MFYQDINPAFCSTTYWIISVDQEFYRIMEEKLIVISCQDETLDSFVKPMSELGLHFYSIHNNLNILGVLEFEAFVFVDVEFK